MDTITTQANLTLDTLLQDATKVADLHILNKDIRKIMITNYEDDVLGYSQDSYLLSINTGKPAEFQCHYLYVQKPV
nr:hypothetical protein [uncultured Blautia sp.]